MTDTSDPAVFPVSKAAPLLSGWYCRAHRDLPWRHTTDAYAVLVSETMLQQTQVERVKSYYIRWMERFPDVTSLATADKETVTALWQGLGYYSRAKNILAAAQKTVSSGYREIPDNADFIASLPGVGPYTAGAVLSIAFNHPVPAVDGNVRRVCSRLLNYSGLSTSSEAVRIFTALTSGVLHHGTPRILTQAMMELGATVCTPGGSPSCPLCPLNGLCRAEKAGTQGTLPVTKKNTILKRNAVALLCGSPLRGYLVRQRPEGGLWSGFYEIPWRTGTEGQSLKSIAEAIADETGMPLRRTGCETTMRFTHWQVKCRLYTIPLPKHIPKGYKIECAEKLQTLPMPSGLRKLIKTAGIIPDPE